MTRMINDIERKTLEVIKKIMLESNKQREYRHVSSKQEITRWEHQEESKQAA